MRGKKRIDDAEWNDFVKRFFFFFFVSGLEKNEGENRTKERKTSVSNVGNDRWTATYATLCLINNDTPGLSMIPQFLT